MTAFLESFDDLVIPVHRPPYPRISASLCHLGWRFRARTKHRSCPGHNLEPGQTFKRLGDRKWWLRWAETKKTRVCWPVFFVSVFWPIFWPSRMSVTKLLMVQSIQGLHWVLQPKGIDNDDRLFGRIQGYIRCYLSLFLFWKVMLHK